MRIIQMPQGLTVKLDDEDYDRISKVPVNYRSDPLRWQGTYCSTDKSRGKFVWYASKTFDYKKWRMHRFIFHLRGIDITGKEIDHIDGDGLNNQFSNLRIATSTQQKVNRNVRNDSRIGFKCVQKNTNGSKYTSYIIIKGKKKSLGSFDTPEEAALAYNRAAIKKYGEYARLNLVTKPKGV